ncbi:hypothetical protein O3S80_50250 [Streptomyces sp. Lzd4kr]|nr:hypothetical protein [Streptomyces sp. Lzd4kr]
MMSAHLEELEKGISVVSLRKLAVAVLATIAIMLGISTPVHADVKDPRTGSNRLYNFEYAGPFECRTNMGTFETYGQGFPDATWVLQVRPWNNDVRILNIRTSYFNYGSGAARYHFDEDPDGDTVYKEEWGAVLYLKHTQTAFGTQPWYDPRITDYDYVTFWLTYQIWTSYGWANCALHANAHNMYTG